jgi:hypothetical protein
MIELMELMESHIGKLRQASSEMARKRMLTAYRRSFMQSLPRRAQLAVRTRDGVVVET